MTHVSLVMEKITINVRSRFFVFNKTKRGERCENDHERIKEGSFNREN